LVSAGERVQASGGNPAARSLSPVGHLVELALDRVGEFLPGCGELGYALIFQDGDHIVV
jgi:hypothetical protein